MDLNMAKKRRRVYSDSKHVLSVSYKPDVSTFSRTLKVVLLGTIVLGLLAFVIFEIVGLITTT
jgi:preprotein translocase subunit Sss1